MDRNSFRLFNLYQHKSFLNSYRDIKSHTPYDLINSQTFYDYVSGLATVVGRDISSPYLPRTTLGGGRRVSGTTRTESSRDVSSECPGIGRRKFGEPTRSQNQPETLK